MSPNTNPQEPNKQFNKRSPSAPRADNGVGPKRSNPKPKTPRSKNGATATGRSVSRGAALRAQKRTVADANRIANQYMDASGAVVEKPRRANLIDDSPQLKIIGLGGMDGGGSKNTMVIEY